VDHQQIETMARDLAALHQTVQQLGADHEQLTRKIAKLQTEKPQANKPFTEKPDKRVLRRVSAHPAAPVAAPVRKPAPITPMPPQTTPQVSTLNPLSPPSQPASQIPSEPQPSGPTPFRSLLRVPQP
jgi:hypothetical protein